MNYNNAEFYTSYGSFKQIPKSERTEIAFSGRSNVGKSSLINKIFNRKSLARAQRGSRQDRYHQLLQPGESLFCRPPGIRLREGREVRQGAHGGTDRGVPSRRPRACAGVPAHRLPPPPTSDDVMMVNFLIDSGIPFVVILTKADQAVQKAAGRAPRFPAERTPLRRGHHYYRIFSPDRRGA